MHNRKSPCGSNQTPRFVTFAFNTQMNKCCIAGLPTYSLQFTFRTYSNPIWPSKKRTYSGAGVVGVVVVVDVITFVSCWHPF